MARIVTIVGTEVRITGMTATISGTFGEATGGANFPG